jgi:hypothetical protein
MFMLMLRFSLSLFKTAARMRKILVLLTPQKRHQAAALQKTAQKQKTRWGLLRQRADECFVLRNSMHTTSGAAYGRDEDGGDAPESSWYENKENRRRCQPGFFGQICRGSANRWRQEALAAAA